MMLKCPAVIPKPYRFTGLKKNGIRKSTGMNNTVPVKNAEIRKSRNELKKKDCRHLQEPKDK